VRTRLGRSAEYGIALRSHKLVHWYGAPCGGSINGSEQALRDGFLEKIKTQGYCLGVACRLLPSERWTRNNLVSIELRDVTCLQCLSAL
jgi:hypothetical protein